MAKTKEQLLQEATLSPNECALVFGRGRKFWRTAADKGKVRCLIVNGRRYLNRADCAAYIAGEFQKPPDPWRKYLAERRRQKRAEEQPE